MSSPEISKRKPLLLPKRYLSWSQLEIYRSNPERYKREYFEKGKRLDTKYLRFGKSIAQQIENGTIKNILPDLAVYKHCEYELINTVRDIPLLSFIDTYSEKENIFREFKTGKNPWNQAKVQKHDQLLFYAVQLRAKTGKMPEFCHLDWIETSENSFEKKGLWNKSDELRLTGKVKSFIRVFDERELDNMEAEIEKIAHQISEAYYQFINEI